MTANSNREPRRQLQPPRGNLIRLTGIVYDLDGTLIDSAANIVAAVNRTRIRYGLEELAPDVVQPYIGDGSLILIERALFGCVSSGYRAPKHVLDSARYEFSEVYDAFLKGYLDDPVGGISLYDGVREALAFFHERQIPQSILTNKPHEVTVAVVDALAIEPFFKHILGPGGQLNGVTVLPKPNPVTLTQIIEEFEVDSDGVWMVGDGVPDVHVAHAAGISSLGLQGGLYPDELLLSVAPPPTALRANFQAGFEFLKSLL